MLTDWKKAQKPDADDLEFRINAARTELAALQTQMKENKVPVLIVTEGWGAAGKGTVLGRVIKNLDPRFFNVIPMDNPTEDDRRKPFLYRYFYHIPEAGKFMFYDGGWMEEIITSAMEHTFTEEDYQKYQRDTICFERQLTDNGYILLKFFFHISEKEQRKRMNDLIGDKNTRWRVSSKDLWQNKHYEKCLDAYDRFMTETNQIYAPWTIVDAKNAKWAELQMTEAIVSAIKERLANGLSPAYIPQNTFSLKPMPKLANVDLDKELSEEEYREQLAKCQKKLSALHNELYRRKIPVIIAYEGWDAAGKGGNIKRIASALDPRGYEVQPIASPEPHEKARHYLWRFWKRLPRTGHIAIFDRTWYGRVMVERLEGFCSENDWKRAYNEMNEFEQNLSDWGAVIIKFWVHIDKDTQLARFTERQNTPEKQWKITDEDWRNREKWDQYEIAIDEMIQKTSTNFAPWHILESNDKKYARIKALKIVINEIEKALEAKK